MAKSRRPKTRARGGVRIVRDRSAIKTRVETPQLKTKPIRFESVNNERGRVSVLIPAFKTPKLVLEAVQSALTQEMPPGWDVEVIVGVDACPQTLAAARTISDPRVRVLEIRTNSGPYRVLNAAFQASSGEVIAILDSDDVMLHGKLRKQLEYIFADYDFVGSLYQVEEQGKRRDGPPVTARPSLNRMGYPIHSTWCVKRQVYQALGGYRGWRCGADTDLWIRALALPVKAFVAQEQLMLRRVRQNQLTSVGTETGPGSVLRTRAQTQVTGDLERYKRGGRPAHGNFQSAPVYKVHGGRPRILAVMPTLPTRQRSAKLVVANLLRQGVDKILIHLNGHKQVPPWAKSAAIETRIHPNGTGPIVRWQDIPESDFVLCVDDDIVYPTNYVRQAVTHLLRVRRGRGISYHGTHWPPGKTRLEDRVILAFSEGCSLFVPKTYFGSGVSAFFHSDISGVDTDAPPQFHRLDDVWMSAAVARSGLLMYRPPSPNRWIDTYPEQEDGIFKAEVQERFRSRRLAIAAVSKMGGWSFTPKHQGLP